MEKLIKYFVLSAIALFSISFTSCGDDDDDVDVTYKDITLKCSENFSIPNGDKATWTSSNKYIASVEGKEVTANHVGSAIISSQKGSFNVTVESSVSVFTEPCLEWSASKKAVKSYMSKYLGSATIKDDTSTSLTYNYRSAQAYLYKFENGALVSSGIGLNGNYIDSDDLFTQMTEHYIPLEVDEENYSVYFATLDLKTGVLLSLQASGSTIMYVIIYMPVKDSKSHIDFKKYRNMFGNYNSTTSDAVLNEFNKMKARF